MMFYSKSVRQARSHVSVSLRVALALACAVTISSRAVAQKSESQHDKKLDVRSSAGDLHVGNDADARKIGLPVYPGARLRHDKNKNNEKDSDGVNFAILTESFGVKLVIANYDSDDPPAKIIDYYRQNLKKFGKVLACHTREHNGDINADPDEHESHGSKELKCEGDNSGPVTELKVGTEENQHLVSVEPRDKGVGSTFALVYLHIRGKQGEILLSARHCHPERRDLVCDLGSWPKASPVEPAASLLSSQE